MGTSVQDTLGRFLRPRFLKSSLSLLQRQACQEAALLEIASRTEDSILSRTVAKPAAAAPHLWRLLAQPWRQSRILIVGTSLVKQLRSKAKPLQGPAYVPSTPLLWADTSSFCRRPSASNQPAITWGQRCYNTNSFSHPAFRSQMHHWGQLVEGGEVYIRSMNQLWYKSMAQIPSFPWNSTWNTIYSMWYRTVRHIPSHHFSGLPQISIINSINLVGQQLPRLTGVFCAEMLRSRRASAQGLGHYMELPSSFSRAPPAVWWRAVLHEISDTAVNMIRLLHLILLFTPVLLTSPLALYLDFKRRDWMELLRRTLEAAGPAFIKWGQWAATRHDLFPPDLCSELEMLHSQAPAHRFKHTKHVIENAFGLKMEELFDEVEEQPVASGSIGQIHRAVLSAKGGAVTGYAPGTTVAVKVRHPGVDSAILRDFAMMLWMAHVASSFKTLQHLRLEDTLKQFAAPLREQVDLSREAHNLWRFNHNFRKTRFVQFPVPMYPLVSPDVLVESYEAGKSISHYIAATHNPFNHRLAELGSALMLQMMLVDNLIHSDLHPGNILVRLEPPQGLVGLAYRAAEKLQAFSELSPLLPSRAKLSSMQKRWLEPRIVLLDVGMATELTGEDRDNMVNVFRAFAGMDGWHTAENVLKFSGNEQTCPDPDSFKSAMAKHFDALKKPGESATGGSFSNGAEALAALLELVRVHQVNLPGHICAVVVTTLVLEGWSHKLDPEHSVLIQVQSMFEPDYVSWRDRIAHAVDQVMDSNEDLTLA